MNGGNKQPDCEKMCGMLDFDCMTERMIRSTVHSYLTSAVSRFFFSNLQKYLPVDVGQFVFGVDTDAILDKGIILLRIFNLTSPIYNLNRIYCSHITQVKDGSTIKPTIISLRV